jgi:hypothetical protein
MRRKRGEGGGVRYGSCWHVGQPRRGESGPSPKENLKFRNLNSFQTCTEFELAKIMPYQIQKNQIKYGCEGIEIRNNFTYRYFFGLEMDWERKIQGRI